ncbi:MAG: RHS repeat domain-containing protein [Telluria sp.]
MIQKTSSKFALSFAPKGQWVRALGFAAVMLHTGSSSAFAGSYDGALGRTKYVTMTGDVNNDGQNDVLMKAVPTLILIPLDDDLNVPIQIPAPGPSFVLLSTGYGTYTLLTNPDAAMMNRAEWTAAKQAITYAGPHGEFAASVTITAASPEQASFVVSMAADTGLLRITSVTAPAINPAAGTSVAGTERYTYDALGRLTTVTYPNGVQATYAYDSAGNRTLSKTTK